MILALFGGSGCGKTTLAKIVSDELGVPVRYCGTKIRDAATASGHDLMSAPDQLHEIVDNQTREWSAEIGEVGVVEGRFLDQVLATIPGVVFIELTATSIERARRLTKRSSRAVGEDEIALMDAQDDLFRRRMYPDTPSAIRAQIVTNQGTALECVQKLISILTDA